MLRFVIFCRRTDFLYINDVHVRVMARIINESRAASLILSPCFCKKTSVRILCGEEKPDLKHTVECVVFVCVSSATVLFAFSVKT